MGWFRKKKEKKTGYDDHKIEIHFNPAEKHQPIEYYRLKDQISSVSTKCPLFPHNSSRLRGGGAHRVSSFMSRNPLFLDINT